MADGSHHKSAQKFAGSLNHAMIDDASADAAQQCANNFGKPGCEDITKCYIDQRYEGYTAENQETWQILFDRQMAFLKDNASQTYLKGAEIINLRRDRVPPLKDINARLWPLTRWQSRAVPGYLPPKAFFACLARREFPTTIVIRPKESIDYLPEPDIFHDIFGHVPLHADPTFADFLQTYGKAALTTEDPAETERLARLFWFTVEFGLIREGGRLKVYGSGLISSPGESRHSLESAEVERRPFDLDRVCDTSFEIDHYQPILYVLDSFEQLRDAMNTYAGRLLAKAKRAAA
jgi:phenylalanine-4-hydroxylase